MVLLLYGVGGGTKIGISGGIERGGPNAVRLDIHVIQGDSCNETSLVFTEFPIIKPEPKFCTLKLIAGANSTLPKPDERPPIFEPLA